MIKGQIVMVYEDPNTKTKEEGKARLLGLICEEASNDNLEYWKVRFLSDGFICDRFINKERK